MCGKILSYNSFEILNEINYGFSDYFSFKKDIKWDEEENCYYIEFEYQNEKGEYKIVSVNFIEPIRIYNDKGESLSEYLEQFNFNYKKLAVISFFEYNKGLDRDSDKIIFDDNVNSFKFLFKKMNTIIEIIKYIKFIKEYDSFIFQSAKNNPDNRKLISHNKRNKFYITYFNYYNVENIFVNSLFRVETKYFIMTLENFYIFKI